MKFKPRPCQEAAVEHAVEFLRGAPPGAKQLYSAPTGYGKSVIELLVQERMGDGCWVVTPRDEIIAGMLDKLGAPADADPMEHRLCTPVKLRNRLLDGRMGGIKYLVFDESHHHSAETWQQLDLLTGFAPAVGYTATPYRGTPRSTRGFRAAWGEPLWLITYQEAEAEGFIRLPTMETLPLVDDDVVEVRGGEFDVTSVESATLDRLSDLVKHAEERWYDRRSFRWSLPTVFAAPSTAVLMELQRQLSARGLPMAVVASGTPKEQRALAFSAAEQEVVALGHINIVSEGVDLKLRRLVDLAPTMSPVKWMQQLGRITRPWDRSPEYVCTNRNVLRHCYALEGAVRVSDVQQADRAFPRTERAHARVLGLEAIGRFKPAAVQSLSGLTCHTYSLSTVVGTMVVEYCCVVHPAMDPIWASKVNTVEGGERKYGSWRPCEAPESVKGFASIGAREPSPKQRKWWENSAARYGLDPAQELTRRSFTALPVLADLGVKLP